MGRGTDGVLQALVIFWGSGRFTGFPASLLLWKGKRSGDHLSISA